MNTPLVTRRGSVFKRLETDSEFRGRLLDIMGRSMANVLWANEHVGTKLDDVVWRTFKMQRRIVEDAL